MKLLLTGRAHLQSQEMIGEMISLKTIANGDEPLLAFRMIGTGVMFQEKRVEDDSGLKEGLMHCRYVQLPAENCKSETSTRHRPDGGNYLKLPVDRQVDSHLTALLDPASAHHAVFLIENDGLAGSNRSLRFVKFNIN